MLIGFFVAASGGTGDFLGGLASRQSKTFPVLSLAQVTSLCGAVALALAVGGRPSIHDLGLGAIAGLLNVMALGCLYRGLAIGNAGQVAPVAAVIASVIPVSVGLITGERPPVVALVGIGIAVFAGGFVSAERQRNSQGWMGLTFVLAVLAGIGFGISIIFFSETGHDSGFWPLLSSRIAGVIGLSFGLLATRTSLKLARRPMRQAVVAGVFDIAATALLLIALRKGFTATVAPVASLGPGFTVMNTWWYLHEKPSVVQRFGLCLALVGLALIAI